MAMMIQRFNCLPTPCRVPLDDFGVPAFRLIGEITLEVCARLKHVVFIGSNPRTLDRKNKPDQTKRPSALSIQLHLLIICPPMALLLQDG